MFSAFDHRAAFDHFENEPARHRIGLAQLDRDAIADGVASIGAWTEQRMHLCVVMIVIPGQRANRDQPIRTGVVQGHEQTELQRTAEIRPAKTAPT